MAVQKKELGLYPNKKIALWKLHSTISKAVTDSMIFEDQQSDFATQTFSFPGGEGEDEDDDDEDDNDNSNDDKDKSKASDDDNPPLDEDVVHSPLPTQTGGKPGKKVIITYSSIALLII